MPVEHLPRSLAVRTAHPNQMHHAHAAAGVGFGAAGGRPPATLTAANLTGSGQGPVTAGGFSYYVPGMVSSGGSTGTSHLVGRPAAGANIYNFGVGSSSLSPAGGSSTLVPRGATLDYPGPTRARINLSNKDLLPDAVPSSGQINSSSTIISSSRNNANNQQQTGDLAASTSQSPLDAGNTNSQQHHSQQRRTNSTASAGRAASDRPGRSSQTMTQQLKQQQQQQQRQDSNDISATDVEGGSVKGSGTSESLSSVATKQVEHSIGDLVSPNSSGSSSVIAEVHQNKPTTTIKSDSSVSATRQPSGKSVDSTAAVVVQMKTQQQRPSQAQAQQQQQQPAQVMLKQQQHRVATRQKSGSLCCSECQTSPQSASVSMSSGGSGGRQPPPCCSGGGSRRKMAPECVDCNECGACCGRCKANVGHQRSHSRPGGGLGGSATSQQQQEPSDATNPVSGSNNQGQAVRQSNPTNTTSAAGDNNPTNHWAQATAGNHSAAGPNSTATTAKVIAPTPKETTDSSPVVEAPTPTPRQTGNDPTAANSATRNKTEHRELEVSNQEEDVEPDDQSQCSSVSAITTATANSQIERRSAGRLSLERRDSSDKSTVL